MKGKWVVLKFGGTSVATLECWKSIARIAKERMDEGLRPIIVCSAVSGCSDEITKLMSEAREGRHAAILKSIEQKHCELAKSLGVAVSNIEQHFKELSKFATGASLIREVSPKLLAKALCTGEMMSTKLGAAFFRKHGLSVSWYDAREHMVAARMRNATDERKILSATCSSSEDVALKKRLAEEKSDVMITQGFIARDEDGDTVLLGRGGSDISASYFAAKLGAIRCEIWTDVPGMYTANPRKIPTARLLKSLEYDEAQEIASSGAKVLHPRCISPLKEHGIPLHIRSLAHPHAEGTIVSGGAMRAHAQVKAISSRSGITLISMESVEMWQQAGFLADIFECFRRHGVSIDLISTSETNVTVTLDRAANNANSSVIKELIRDLSEFCTARAIDSCAIVSLVGRNIRAILHHLAPALEVFEEQKIYLVSQAANDLNITFVVDEDQAERLVQGLHGQLFRQEQRDPHLGSTWKDLTEAQSGKKPKVAKWWRAKSAALVKLARKGSPVFVYDRKTIEACIEKVKSITAVDRSFYALKANWHPEILKICYEAGLGFECVSPGEIKHVLGIFRGIDPSRILFTPNFAGAEEYEYGFEKKVMVTLDNQYPLDAWPRIFRGRDIFLRIDPGEGKGHHKYVRTAGAKSKFGVWPSELAEVSKLLKMCAARVTGLHAHVGSNILSSDTWSKNALFLASVAERFPDVTSLDLGGGLGVVERPGQDPLDFSEVNANLKKAKAVNPKYKLWIEPGRFIVAEAGVLLARVTQTKQKGEYAYVGIDAGMNTLIRPALYGAYHEIVNLSQLDEEPNHIANIVGPICESGDILGYDRQIAKPQDGDVILIATAGAYGRAMSSSYNMRDPAGEVFV